MRVLLLNQFFWPDSAATSQLLSDVARELVSRGHEVHVICAEAGYALEDATAKPDVKIYRVKSLRFLRGAAGRLASYASFYVSALWTTLRVTRPDVVVTLTTPPLLSLLGTAAKFLRGARHFIWEMDMYPDIAVDLGYIRRGGIADRFIGMLADFGRRHADGVLALGACMQERLQLRGLSLEKIHVAENWADSRQISSAPWPEDRAPLTVLYSGNLGLAHDVETIYSAIVALQSSTQYRFIFAGGGARRKTLEAECREHRLTNVEFRPYSAKAFLGESLGSGHIGLITQQNASLGAVVPSKVYGLLAAGRPILFIGPRQSTVAGVIRRFDCGWQVDCNDTDSLLQLLGRLANNRKEVEQAGLRARLALIENYDLTHGVSRVCDVIGAFPQHPNNKQGAIPAQFLPAEEEQLANSF